MTEVAKAIYKSAVKKARTAISYLIFQGIRYMTLGEALYKIGVTLVFTIVLLSLGWGALPSLLTGHLLNLILNSQIPVLARYIVKDVGLNKAKVRKAVLKIRLTAKQFGLCDVLIFGSMSRHSMGSNSDLDLRFYHKPGFKNSLLAYIYASYIRLWANLTFTPIDVYCFSDVRFLSKLRLDENPISLFFHSVTKGLYPAAQKFEVALAQNGSLR